MMTIKEARDIADEVSNQEVAKMSLAWHRWRVSRRIKNACHKGLYKAEYFIPWNSSGLQSAVKEIQQELRALGYQTTFFAYTGVNLKIEWSK